MRVHLRPSNVTLIPGGETESSANVPSFRSFLTLEALKYFCINQNVTMETKGIFQFEIIINVFVSSFQFI